MTNPQRTPSLTPAPESTPVGWWDRAAIIALGGAGCALSYDALQQMAVAIHVRPQLSYLFPLVIDGFIAYGIRALLVMSTAPLRARLYTWTLFATATTASIWANALHAVRLNQQTHPGGLRLSDHVVAVLSTIAPLALAGAVHLYILITRHHPARDTTKDQPQPDRPTTLVPVRADPDGTIRTGPHDPLRHTVRADHTHDLRAERTADRGPDQTGGPQRGPADHAEAGPQQRTTGRDHPADQDPADHRGGNHPGPDDRGPGDQGVGREDKGPDADSADRPRDHAGQPAAEPQTAAAPAAEAGPEATASDTTEVSAAQLALDGPITTNGAELSPAGPASAEPAAEAADPAEEPTDQSKGTIRDGGPADHAGTASGDQSPQGTSGPDHAADHGHRGDHPTGPADHARGPADGTSGPDLPVDHHVEDHRPSGDRGPAQQKRTGPEHGGVAGQAGARTADRTGTVRTGAAEEIGAAAGLEELLSIARQAALSEGRMTRRALRPYLNEAGVPISNRRFTDLQRRLYADPKLAHLPRPGKRP